MQLDRWSCIRVGDAKLTLDPEGLEPRELYRLTDDPFEEHDLVADAAERDTVERLQAAYVDWLADARTRLGDPEEAARPSPAL